MADIAENPMPRANFMALSTIEYVLHNDNFLLYRPSTLKSLHVFWSSEDSLYNLRFIIAHTIGTVNIWRKYIGL